LSLSNPASKTVNKPVGPAPIIRISDFITNYFLKRQINQHR
jgi:hypothetical protein